MTVIRRDAELAARMARATESLQEAIEASIAFRRVRVSMGDKVEQIAIEGWLWLLDGPKTVLRGTVASAAGTPDAVGPDAVGRSLLLVFDLPDAITISGTYVGAPAEAVAERRRTGQLSADDDALTEVGSILMSALSQKLGDSSIGEVDLRFRDLAVVRPGFDQDGVLDTGERVIYELRLQLEDLPESVVYVVLDPDLAKAWNGGELFETETNRVRPSARDGLATAVSVGSMTAYLLEPGTQGVVQSCCQGLSLTLDRRPISEIPNPSAFRDDLIVIEVPKGESRRFDWAKRLKSQSPSTRVVLLLHEPSRPRVIEGLTTKADAVVAWPVDDIQLSARLAGLVS